PSSKNPLDITMNSKILLVLIIAIFFGGLATFVSANNCPDPPPFCDGTE
ncbi:18537_t:CDS:2, partial [Acaulospora morrowiae]